MKRKMIRAGLVALGLALPVCGLAEAQALHRHPARHAAADPGAPGTATNGAGRAAGRQIVVHPRQSYLTAGTIAFPGEYNGYALDTFAPIGVFNPGIDRTFVGMRGLERLPNNFTVPGCCVP